MHATSLSRRYHLLHAEEKKLLMSEKEQEQFISWTSLLPSHDGNSLLSTRESIVLGYTESVYDCTQICFLLSTTSFVHPLITIKKVFAVPRWSFTWTLAIFDSRVAVRKARKWEVLSTRTSGNYRVNRITVQFNPFSGMKWLMWLSQAEISIWRQKMNEVPKAGWVYELNFVPLEPKAWQITKWCPFKKGYTN